MPSIESATLSFTAHLASLAGEAGLAKGERTRLRLKAGAAELLAAKGYHDLVMLDISRAADLSNGAVYKYFENKQQIAIEISEEFFAFIGEILAGIRIGEDPYEGICEAYRCYVEIYMQNVGLMRCLHQLSDTLPEVGRLWSESLSGWSLRLAQLVNRGTGAPESEAERMIPLVRALALMGSEFLYDLFVRRSAELADLDQSSEGIAAMLATIFYRAIYGRQPEHMRG